MSAGVRHLLACAIVMGSVATLAAAELTTAASQAFAEYAERTRRTFMARVTQPVAPAQLAALDGKALARAAGGDGILEAPDSLIHHWFAAILIPDATLDEVLRVSRDYDSYPAIFKPVQRSQVLTSTDESVRVRLRMRESAGGISATLDVQSFVLYARVDERHAYSVSHSEEIHEIKDAGRPGERQLPVGRDSGYLWHGGAFTRFVEVDGGVYMEMETLALSRRFPPLLGWIIEPIARRIGRKSVEQSVQEFRTAVLMRHGPDSSR